ncbi:hypothetical protein [Streptomyces sp. NPDC059072]
MITIDGEGEMIRAGDPFTGTLPDTAVLKRAPALPKGAAPAVL